jgi:transcriptional regulator with XRE-family HTH domain
MQNKNYAQRNNLLEFRRRAGLEPKQISFLLGKKSTDDLYRYENGNRYPNLPTVLKLAIILATPPHFLYQDFYQELKDEIAEKRNSQPHLFPERAWFPNNAGHLAQEEYCFYADILKSRIPTALELQAVNRHSIALINTISDYRQGRNPYSL